MTDDAGTRWSINLQGKLGPLQLSTKPEIAVHGKGHAGVLSPGMNVAFFAKADKKNKLQGDVGAVKIFTPAADTQYGMFASLPVADLAPAGDKPEASELKDVQVFGKVSTIKGDALTVAVPGGTLKAKLAEGCEVVLETNDYSLVRPGDVVNAQVAYAEPSLGVAVKVDFEMAQSLGGEQKPKKPLFSNPALEKAKAAKEGEAKAPEGAKPDGKAAEAKPGDAKPAEEKSLLGPLVTPEKKK
jgi:hypothetical protein